MGKVFVFVFISLVYWYSYKLVLYVQSICIAHWSQVLEYFNASPEDYSCIFTSGATAALKLVGETFPWTNDSNFLYTMENHNSVLGIREYALGQGASACAVDIEEATNQPGQLASPGPFIKVKHRAVQMRNTSKLQKEESRGPLVWEFSPSSCIKSVQDVAHVIFFYFWYILDFAGLLILPLILSHAYRRCL